MKNSNAQCLRLADSFRVSYGKSFIDVKVSCGADLLSSPSEFFALPDEGVAEALENCVYSESFDECVRQSERVLFIFPDITRKSGLQRFFHRMLETVKKHGKDFSVTFAVGTHRPVTDAEKEEILGASYAACAGRFIEHDCEDLENHAFFGITKLKTPVLINKMYMEHDLIVPVGAVGYHYFAGYGGGRKLVFPGIAAKKSIMRNHMLALDSSSGKRHPMAANGELNRNPVHRDIVDALMIARSDKTFFSVNTVLDEDGSLVDMVCGDLFMAHQEACNKLDDMFSVNTGRKYGALVVSCGGFPRDINMVQAQKSLDRAAAVAEEGASVYFFAECPDGYGNSYFQEFFDIPSSGGMLLSLLDDYQINRQTAFNLRSLTERFKVKLISSFSPEEAARMGFEHISPSSEITIETEEGSAAFLPSAGLYLFR